MLCTICHGTSFLINLRLLSAKIEMGHPEASLFIYPRWKVQTRYHIYIKYISYHEHGLSSSSVQLPALSPNPLHLWLHLLCLWKIMLGPHKWKNVASRKLLDKDNNSRPELAVHQEAIHTKHAEEAAAATLHQQQDSDVLMLDTGIVSSVKWVANNQIPSGNEVPVSLWISMSCRLFENISNT